MPLSLVTGGAGFIGAHVTHELVRLGHEVVVLDDLSGGFRENVDSAAHVIEGSVTDHALVASLFDTYPVAYVYHLAAYAAEGLSHFIRRFNYTNNVVGSVNVINEAVKHNIKCFVFTSSIAAYGDLPSPMREDMTLRPADPYGIAKAAVEQDLRVARQMFGLNHVIFRPHNVYGEYQNIGDRYRNVVGIFMNQLMQGRPLTIFGDGTQTRAFSYIGDVAPYIARSALMPEAQNEVFNIGADQEHTVNELAAAVMRVMGQTGDITHLPPRIEVKHASCDHAKARRVFKMEASIPLVEGLARMAEWAKRVGVRKTKKFGEVEITDRLPPIWLEE